MRIVSWNVNGIQNPFNYYPWNNKKSYKEVFEELKADIVCFQELKMQKDSFPQEFALIEGYEGYFTFPTTRKGYSGVGIYVKKSLCTPIKAEEGITGILPVRNQRYSYIEAPPHEQIGYYPKDIDRKAAKWVDDEGRCILLDLGMFILIGVYCPVNSGDHRMDYRRAFYKCLRDRISAFIKEGKRKVVLVGDVNILCDSIDTADQKDIIKESLVPSVFESRTWLRELLKPHRSGLLLDIGRIRHPTRKGMFTCWNTRLNMRPTNYGTRIDYTLATPDLLPWVQDADIMAQVMGSDHCPIYIDFRDSLDNVPLYELLSHAKDPPSLSACHHSAYRPSKNIHSMFQKFEKLKKSKSESDIDLEDSSKTPSHSPSAISGTPSSVPENGPPEKRRRTQQPKLSTFFMKKPQSTDKNEGEKVAPPMIEVDDIESKVTVSNSSNVESVTAWKSMFQKKLPPLCDGHKEPCKLLTVKKPGINYGRKFWMCARPIGEVVENSNAVSDDDKQPFQCRYFLWDSDWKG
ncbi:AP-endonuclease Apn2 [Schizosaccharomyces cryophilus OY26]|uniref:DNA-(apurinic or apyrimidinic site) endonuclease 2 n=1 Tax=Schizosaccharomyces cryophilus (strain OY26 / ATCC MYA-4695 / CBS 11777 / NBRC 106824 / NRRL Y48691) TaxID=653667 RepID=S9VT48_SCHCR|nr:AP-endonuclease Apn2 [Schizosaccharomyces cryophilus OY26]EPY49305.1 AP-endonuclease Apn2 [Schizosaccharomyces cryophilus OY26]